MKICGVEIKGREAIFAVAVLKDGAVTHVPLPTRKISLADDDDAANVRSFSELVEGYVRDNGIDHFAIKKRGKKGEYAGGPTTFKIEGVLQLLRNCVIELVSPQTVSAQNKKHNFDLPVALNKYQHEAYLTACAAIARESL